MPRRRVTDLVMVPIAALVVLGQDMVWPSFLAAGRAIAAWPPLLPLRRWIGRLPAIAALPLFLVPEACSRLGTLVSAWLLLQGDGWRALAIYVATKLLAGGSALWIYTACEPTLLRIKAFAALHGALAALRRSLLARIRERAARHGAVPPP